MGLLEDLNSGKYNLVLFGILFIFMFHQYWRESKFMMRSQCKEEIKESMSNVSNDIKEAVKQVYLADVEAIRNLSEIATKINAGTFVFPGNLNVTGSFKANGEISNNSFSLSRLNNSINNVNSSLTGTINNSINSVNSNLTNQVNSINSQLSNKLSNNGQVTIEIQPQAGRVFHHANHKLARRTYDHLLYTGSNPTNDTYGLYNWKLTAV